MACEARVGDIHVSSSDEALPSERFSGRGALARARPVHVGGRARALFAAPPASARSFLPSRVSRASRASFAMRASSESAPDAPTADAASREGRCFCGATRVTLAGAPIAVSICHCVNCRKLSGAPFSSRALVKADQVAVHREDGVGDLVGFASSPAVERFRCARCASRCTPPWPRGRWRPSLSHSSTPRTASIAPTDAPHVLLGQDHGRRRPTPEVVKSGGGERADAGRETDRRTSPRVRGSRTSRERRRRDASTRISARHTCCDSMRLGEAKRVTRRARVAPTPSPLVDSSRRRRGFSGDIGGIFICGEDGAGETGVRGEDGRASVGSDGFATRVAGERELRGGIRARSASKPPSLAPPRERVCRARGRVERLHRRREPSAVRCVRSVRPRARRQRVRARRRTRARRTRRRPWRREIPTTVVSRGTARRRRTGVRGSARFSGDCGPRGKSKRNETSRPPRFEPAPHGSEWRVTHALTRPSDSTARLASLTKARSFSAGTVTDNGRTNSWRNDAWREMFDTAARRKCALGTSVGVRSSTRTRTVHRKVDLADDALVRGIVGSDPIADGEGTVQDDDERSQDVRGGVSEGEGHEKRADGGEGCEDVHVRVPHAEEPSEEEVREERLERSAIEQRGGRARTPRHAGQHRGIVRVPRPQFLLLASLPAPAFPLPLDAFALRLAHPLLRFLDVAIQRALILGEFPRAFIQPLRAFVPRGVRGVDHLRVHAGRARTLRAGAGAGRDGPAGRGGRGGRGGRRPAPPPATARRRSVCASRAAAISLRSATCSSASAARILMIHIERSSNSRSVLRSSATSTSSRFDEDFPHPPKHPGAAAPRSASSRRPSSVDSGSGSFDDAVDGRLSARYSLRTSMGFVPAETARCASRLRRGRRSGPPRGRRAGDTRRPPRSGRAARSRA